MSVFDTSKNSAICVLPWVHEFVNVQGHTGPCCQGGKFSKDETIESIRKQMLSGIQPKVCGSCYKTERSVNWSYRLKETAQWLQKFGEPKIDDPKLEYIDLRFDPTCNMKCKTCNVSESTLWQKEKGIKLPRNVDTKKYFENVDKKILKKVYLAGGEPTFIPDYLEFLQELHKLNPKCEVIVNSNLKRLPDAWKDIFAKFENLTVTCSCDAIELLGTYVRYPLDWKVFEDNVKFVSKNVNFLQFNIVTSNLTTHKIFETCSWLKQYSKNINLSILKKPYIFTENAVPNDVRQTYIESLQKITKFPVGLYFAQQFRQETKLLLKRYGESYFQQDLLTGLRNEIEAQDSKRSLKLKDVDPFLYSWIYR